jgi:hypothetical protein
MQHLTPQFGHIECAVPFVARTFQQKSITNLEEFYSYPQEKGWRLNDFLLEEGDPTNHQQRTRKACLLQSWLFFGLISLVIRTADGPLIPKEKLFSGDFINTTEIPEYLELWRKWALENTVQARLRMIRSELALDFARRVVRRNLATEVDDNREILESVYGQESPDFVSPEVVLSIMVMGETLSATKNEIAASLKLNMPGWHKDDEEGWGPPPYVIDKMKQTLWCPRSIHLLRGQLGSYATLLLAAFESHQSIKQSDQHQKRNCTKKECFLITDDESPPGNDDANETDVQHRAYAPKHVLGCRKGDSCLMRGPPMSEIYEILRDHDDTESVPIIEIVEDSNGRLELQVKRWVPGEPNFATISHVWSDGLGNEGENQIYNCQLVFIKSLLKKVAAVESGNKTLRFWMDTLVIPVRSEDSVSLYPMDFEELKKKAIRQIYNVFAASSHSIVIDKGLLSIDASGLPWKVVTKLLASGWMRRLWTLQEAYLSKRLWITFKQGEQDYSGMKDFDELINSIPQQNGLTGSFAEMARQKLMHNIMGEEREERNLRRRHSPTTQDRALLIANTWRAARWRVSFPLHKFLIYN